MIAIREEIGAIEKGDLDRQRQPARQRAAHGRVDRARRVAARVFARMAAAYPQGPGHGPKYWPPVRPHRRSSPATAT